jgi:cell division protein FtsX
MLAFAAAVVFGLALILDWANADLGDAFTTMTLLMLGLLLLSLHVAGVGATFRPRVGTRRR